MSAAQPSSIFMSSLAISHHLHDLCRNAQAGGGAATQDTEQMPLHI